MIGIDILALSFIARKNLSIGLKSDSTINDSPVYVPQSWMASNRANKIIYDLSIKKIIAVPINLYNNDMSYI